MATDIQVMERNRSWQSDEEHRELAGVLEEVMFATKPQLAGARPDHARAAGIRAAFVAGDEVYGGRQLRRGSASARWAM